MSVTSTLNFPPNKKVALESTAQDVADFLKKNDKKASPIKAKFPRGFIRRLDDIRTRWPYLTEDRQRTLSCVIQLCDVNRFHLNVWDIKLTAGTMWEWHTTIPVVSLIEALLHEVGVQENFFCETTTFNNSIDILYSHGLFEEDIKNSLHALRKYRNSIHLHLIEKPVELSQGKPRKYNEAVHLLHDLEEALKKYFSE